MCYTMHNNTLGNCAHFFRKRETMTTKDYQTRRPLRIFLSYFRPHRGLFLLDISCAFLIAVIDLAFPLISRTAMYHWLPDKQFSIFFTVMALVVAAFVLRAGLYFVVGYWGHTFGILVEADIRQMRLYGISIENILQLMQAQNLSIPAGSITYESGSINVASSGLFENLADIENTVVAGAEDSLSFVKLKDVAQVYIEDADESYYTQDGRDAVLLVGKLEKGENAVNIGKELRRTLDGIKAEMPEDLIFHEVMYAPQDIENNINSFILNLLESILLIVLVVMLGVRVRNALVISVALPMSILMTFIVMQLLSIEFQFISIAALIVSLGILVDNAVVISEAIQQNLNAGQERQEAILGAVRVTAVPVLTSTLTTVVTFSVIYFVPGVVGQVAGAIPTVVIAALGASYLVAMFLIPVLASFFFTPEPPGRAAGGGASVYRGRRPAGAGVY